VLESALYWIARDERTVSEFQHYPPPRMLMIRGSSGTGKSYFVKCVARRAFELLKERNIPLHFFEITCSSLFSSWYGQSARNMDLVLGKALSQLSLVFIDEIDAVATRMGEITQAVDKEDVRVVKTLLRRLDEIESNPELRIVVVAASNQYEKIPFDVRRRLGRPLDFDVGITSEMLLAVVQAQLDKYKWDFSAVDVKTAIEDGVRSVGHSMVTPDDVMRAFQQVYEETRPSRVDRLGAKVASRVEAITPEDFKRVARTVRSFAEEEKVEIIKNFATKVRPRETLMDVGGLIGRKEEIIKQVTLALSASLHKKMGIEPAKGFLMYGPPGTGKTLLAKAIANEANATLYLVNGPELIQKFTGQSEQAVKDLFTEAKKNQPSIIFIDEIDAIAVARGMGGMPSVVNQLLSELDGMRGLEGVVVIATTNRADILDSALLRPGRLTRQVEIPLPRNDEERLDILDIYLRKIATLLDSSVTSERVLEVCKEKVQTPAELTQIVKDAATLRVKELIAREKFLEATLSPEKAPTVKQLYQKDLERLSTILGIPLDDHGFPETLPKLSEENYKITVWHFERAADELSKRDVIERMRKAQEVYRSPEPEVGKVNSLVALGDDARWGLVGVVECVVFPDGQGRIDVTGSVQESVVESSKQARTLLRRYFPKIKDYDVHVQLVTPMEGVDEQRLKAGGPSAGVAISVAMLSSYLNIPVKSDVAVTGKIDVLAPGRVGIVGGVDWRGFGKILAALQDGRIKQVYIPEGNYKEIDQRDLEFFEKRGVKILPISTLWGAVEHMLMGAPSIRDLESKQRSPTYT
ncbi:MAG: AAA family ATPase, partial [Candidatus Bathyarchaeia archaeon]